MRAKKWTMGLWDSLRFIVSHPLNRPRKARAIWLFAAWQIRSRVIRGPHLCEWVGGSRLLVRSGETGLTGNLYTGLHEFQEMGFLLHFLRPGWLFADVGANSGAYTILAGAVSGARVCCFEPFPGAYERLVANVRLNRLDDRVRCVRKCVGAELGFLELTRDEDTENHVVVGACHVGKTLSVEVTTLDVELASEDPVLLKVDVEGFETAVLQGARRTLAKESLKAIILETNGSGGRYGFDEDQIPGLLSGAGFGMFAYDPLKRALKPAIGRSLHGNTLFVRDAEYVAPHLAEGPVIKVNGCRL